MADQLHSGKSILDLWFQPYKNGDVKDEFPRVYIIFIDGSSEVALDLRFLSIQDQIWTIYS